VLAWIPFAAIAGLLVLVGWTLLDLPRWRRLGAASRQELGVALITLAATVSVRLEIAVLIGSALSLGLYLHRTSRPAMRTMGFGSPRGDVHRPFVVVEHTADALPECPQLKLLRMEGSVYFGATAHVADRLQALRERRPPQKHLLVMAKSMNFVDVAGSELWRQELQARRALGGDLYFHRPRPPVLAQWRRDGFLDELGPAHIFPDKRRAIAAITRTLDRAICRRCTARVFEECGVPHTN
jgi:SulP family sulfate permease